MFFPEDPEIAYYLNGDMMENVTADETESFQVLEVDYRSRVLVLAEFQKTILSRIERCRKIISHI